MPSFLVEAFLPRTDAGDPGTRDRALRRAAAASTRAGTPVRFAGSIYIPDDEVCLCRVEAPSSEAAAAVVEHGGLRSLRVVAAVASGVGR